MESDRRVLEDHVPSKGTISRTSGCMFIGGRASTNTRATQPHLQFPSRDSWVSECPTSLNGPLTNVDFILINPSLLAVWGLSKSGQIPHTQQHPLSRNWGLIYMGPTFLGTRTEPCGTFSCTLPAAAVLLQPWLQITQDSHRFA